MSDFDARMGQLRARFLERATAEREQLAAALGAGDLASLERLAHGLSGSAGVFGFSQISRAAQQLEEWLTGGGGGDADVERLCRDLLAEIDLALQEG